MHENDNHCIPTGHVGFPWEWEQDCCLEWDWGGRWTKQYMYPTHHPSC